MKALAMASEGKLFIGGQWSAPTSDARIEVVSPYSEQAVGAVAAADRADIDRAVAAARDAFEHGPWPHMAVSERIAVLRRLGEEFARRVETMAQTITLEMGSPISASRGAQTAAPIAMLDAFTRIAESYPWRELRRTPTGASYVNRQPKGVIAAIVPWNAPMMTTSMKLGPALLSGCSFILKPAAETPLSALLLWRPNSP